MKIQYNDIGKQWAIIKKTVSPKIYKFFESGQYVDREPIEKFEREFAEYCGVKHAIMVSNGTDGLRLAVESLDLGPFSSNAPVAIVIPANGYIADALIAPQLGCELILIDCDIHHQMDTNLLEHWLENYRQTYGSVVIMPIHMYGIVAPMISINKLALEYECKVIEDASHAHGALYYGQKTGSLAHIGVFSLYPGKNLGAAGEAGIITTDDSEYAEYLTMRRQFGCKTRYICESMGWNNKPDTLQAIILSEKLKFLDVWNISRRTVAWLYNERLKNISDISLPIHFPFSDINAVYHCYVIKTNKRDKLQQYLFDKDIPTLIHWPQPIQKSEPFKGLDFGNPIALEMSETILSLPMHPFLTINEIEYITDSIKEFYV